MAILMPPFDSSNPQQPLTRPPRDHVYERGIHPRFNTQVAVRRDDALPLTTSPSVADADRASSIEPGIQAALRRNDPLPSPPSTTSVIIVSADRASSVVSVADADKASSIVEADTAGLSETTSLSIPAVPPSPQFRMTPDISAMQLGFEANAHDVPVLLCSSDETKSRYAHFKVAGEPGFMISCHRRTTLRLVWADDHPQARLLTGVMLEAWHVRAVEPDWVQFRLAHESLPNITVLLDFPLERTKLSKRWRIYRWWMMPHILLNSHEPLRLGNLPAEVDDEYVIAPFLLVLHAHSPYSRSSFGQ